MSQLLDAITGVPNACEPVPGIVTGGQPALEHLAALKRAGCAVVIDIREPMEPQPFRAPEAVTAAGLEYRSIPVGHGAVSDATFGRVLDALRGLGGKKPAYVYCASGNRVGAALLPYFMLEQGMDEEEAVAQALRVGLRSAELMEQALAYARSRQGI
jgi:rhodanese-related sulfurtransferase